MRIFPRIIGPHIIRIQANLHLRRKGTVPRTDSRIADTFRLIRENHITHVVRLGILHLIDKSSLEYTTDFAIDHSNSSPKAAAFNHYLRFRCSNDNIAANRIC